MSVLINKNTKVIVQGFTGQLEWPALPKVGPAGETLEPPATASHGLVDGPGLPSTRVSLDRFGSNVQAHRGRNEAALTWVKEVL